RRDPPIAVGWHLHRLLLNRVSQLHLLCLLCDRLEEPIVAGSTDVSRTAQPGYCFFFFADLLVDGAPPLTATCCSSKLRNMFLKNRSPSSTGRSSALTQPHGSQLRHGGPDRKTLS